MPTKSFRRRKYSRRFARGRFASRKASSRIIARKRYTRRRYRKVGKIRSKWVSPIPYTKLFKFVYTDTGFYPSWSLNTYAYYIFRGNSCYDPDYSGFGVQPYGWDEYTPSLFQYYNVYASKITVYITAGVLTESLRCMLIATRDITPSYYDESDLSTYPFKRSFILDSDATPTRRRKLKMYMSCRKQFRNVTCKDNVFSAAYNSNPNFEWYWLIYFFNKSDTAEMSVYFDVKIKYYARLIRTDTINES